MKVSSSLPTSRLTGAASQSGFTLMELLVTVVIMVILISIAIPGWQAAREKVYTSVCAGRLRQLGIAATLYRAENDNAEIWHLNTENGTQQFWGWYMIPYLPNQTAAVKAYKAQRGLRCPKYTTGGYNYTGYLFNINFSNVRMNGYPGATTVLAWEDTQKSSYGGGQPNPSGNGAWMTMDFRHQNRCHLLMLDGHVEPIDKREGYDTQHGGNVSAYPEFVWK